MGFYLNKNQDFVTINREGINILSLSAEAKKSILSDNGQHKMIHSLESTNYLKIDKANIVNFEFASD